MNKKRGISLIVLVITILIMIILAAAVIITLTNSGALDLADQAVTDTDLKQLQNIATITWSEAYLDTKSNPTLGKEYIEQKVLAALEQAGMDKTRYEVIITDKGVDVIDKLAGTTNKPGAVQMVITPTKIERTIKRGTPETEELTATTAANLTGNIEWSSNNEGVATVEGDGKTGIVTMHEAGTAIITAKCGNVTATSTVVVKVNDSSAAITLDKTKLNVNMLMDDTVTKTITATLINTKENIVWTIDNEDVATVSANGNVATLTIKARGEATLTAKAGKASTTCKITVDDWKASVSSIVDGVPIPKGFVASPYEGENEKSKGLVIYELTTEEIANGVTDITSIDGSKLASQKGRNQFVWIPVNPDNFDTEFVRKDYTNIGYNLSDKVGAGLGMWELALSDENMPTEANNNSSYMTEETYKEAVAMYASVKKYGGYYMGRYEAGAATTTTKTDLGYTEYIANTSNGVTIRLGNYPATYQSELNAMPMARSLYPATGTTYGVVSTLTYGVQWDRMIGWWLEEEPTLDVVNSIAYGNYPSSSLGGANSGAKYAPSNYQNWYTGSSKAGRDTYLFTTGAFNTACKFNLYDVAGNLEEITMEQAAKTSTKNHYITRGGDFHIAYGNSVEQHQTVGRRQVRGLDLRDDFYNVGFRPALYIK